MMKICIKSLAANAIVPTNIIRIALGRQVLLGFENDEQATNDNKGEGHT
jgi:hypothetical protein